VSIHGKSGQGRSLEKKNGKKTDPRKLTDQSLREERIKTDRVINTDLRKIEIQSDQRTLASRLAADAQLDQARTESDIALGMAPTRSTAKALSEADAVLQRERELIDQAQQEARRLEDLSRNRERFQKRLIAAALLETERRITDVNLGDERKKSDKFSQANTAKLNEEKISHEKAKTALVTRDEFLAVVSHDLKNPLRAVSVGASLLRRSLTRSNTDPKIWSGFLDAIEISAATMDRLISDLLDVERMAHGKLILEPVETDIRALLDECAGLFAPLVLSKSFSMTVECASPGTLVECDYDRILQVVSNLVGNALKFTPAGGSIELSAEMKSDSVEIAVADNGPGIPAPELLRVFDRFSQLKPDGRGLGLGLCIAKWIVEAHSGRIWVTSTPGKGSTFRFCLPLKVDAAD